VHDDADGAVLVRVDARLERHDAVDDVIVASVLAALAGAAVDDAVDDVVVAGVVAAVRIGDRPDDDMVVARVLIDAPIRWRRAKAVADAIAAGAGGDAEDRAGAGDGDDAKKQASGIKRCLSIKHAAASAILRPALDEGVSR
jgi:hypothetical protein